MRKASRRKSFSSSPSQRAWRRAMRVLIVAGLGVCASSAFADDEWDDKSSFSVGLAQEVSQKTKTVSHGVEFGVERTLIEDVLEVELSLSDMSHATEHEVGASVVFNKPFRIDRRTEMEFGIGRTYTRGTTSSDNGWLVGMELRRWVTHDWGWYVQASSTAMSRAADHSTGVTTGLIFSLQ
jgi:hypothetical protein